MNIKYKYYRWLVKSRRWCNTPTGEKWVSRVWFAVTLIAAINIILLTAGLILS